MKLKQLVMLIIVFVFVPMAAKADSDLMEVAFEEKRNVFETLWGLSMNQVDHNSLSGELRADRWEKLYPRSSVIRETTALLVQRTDGEIAVLNPNMGDKSSVSLSFQTSQDQLIIGRFHTHPFQYESLSDLPFSPRDLVDLYQTHPSTQLREGYFSLIKSGKKYFALKVVNQELARAYFRGEELAAKTQGKTLFDYLYKKFYSINRGQSIQDIQLNSLKFILGASTDSGIELLENHQDLWKRLN